MARNTSRFSKLLDMIGLVEERDDTGYDQGRAPQGAQTYNPSSRRQQQSSARPVRQQGYDEPRYAPRYDDRSYESSRQDYDAGRYGASNYNSQRDDYRSGQYDRVSARPDYDQQRRSPSSEYRSGSSSSDYRNSAPRNDNRGSSRAESSRNDYYSQRNPAPAARNYEPTQIQEARPSRDNAINISADGRAQTVIYYLHALEECRDVIQDILDNKTVLLNLEDMDERLIQRGIDTLCGAAFALNATLRKASDKTYLIAPNSVAVAQQTQSERY